MRPYFSDVTLLKLKFLIEDYNNKEKLNNPSMRTSFVVIAAVAAFMSGSNAIQIMGASNPPTLAPTRMEKKVLTSLSKAD